MASSSENRLHENSRNKKYIYVHLASYLHASNEDSVGVLKACMISLDVNNADVFPLYCRLQFLDAQTGRLI